MSSMVFFSTPMAFYQSHAFHLAGCGIHVTATAHTLHDDLYIDLINGSGADIDLAPDNP